MKKKSFDPATGAINNTIRNQYAYLYDGSVGDLQIEEGKAEGFEAWKIDVLSNLSEDEKKRFIPFFVEEDMIKLYNKARGILIK